jgi:hypothetical protein
MAHAIQRVARARVRPAGVADIVNGHVQVASMESNVCNSAHVPCRAMVWWICKGVYKTAMSVQMIHCCSHAVITSPVCVHVRRALPASTVARLVRQIDGAPAARINVRVPHMAVCAIR